jgi:ATP-dependent Lon protease
MATIRRADDVLEIGDTLAVMPLRDVVVYPHMIVPLLVGRPGSVAALQEAAAGDRLLFVTAQRSPDVVDPGPDDVHRMGVVARILQQLKLPDGTLKVLIQGVVRARMARTVAAANPVRARIQVLEDVETTSPEVEALQRRVATQFSEYVRLNKRIPDEVLVSVVGIEDPSTLSDTIAAHVIGKVGVKQRVLEAVDLATRFRTLGQVLTEELEILHIERKIEGDVKSQVKRNQKEFYLNEQLKAIRRELGQTDVAASDTEALEEAIEGARMSAEAETQARRELDRLARMPSLSPEAGVVRTYIETLCALPWKRASRDRIDLEEARRTLDADHHGLDKVKDRILEFLAVAKLTRSFRGPILCLVGPPGVGKTSLGRSIATAMGRRFVRVSLGGVHDEAEIRGHRRTYVGAMPGRIVQSLRRCETHNPVFLLDEIDKLAHDYRGDPAAALLEALDPEQNATFSDHYLEVPFDLSKVLFVTTANVSQSIPPALLDRMEVIHLPGYLDHEKRAIATRFLLPKAMREHGVPSNRMEVTEPAVDAIVHGYTREAGVRNLERELGRLCRKVARQIVEAPPTAKRKRLLRIDRNDLATYLGVAPHTSHEVPAQAELGVATGLAWTASGGAILPIEVTRMRGRGKLILTGHLGQVMRESARAALSYVRSVAPLLGVKRDAFDRIDLHVHVPEGAIPKDGPSAGVAMATAIASLMSGKPVDRRIGMTGEVTLRGRVLAIGGLAEKTVAAQRAGVRQVLIPQDNHKDIQELPADVRATLDLVSVRTMEEVLALTLGIRARKPVRSQATARSADYAH